MRANQGESGKNNEGIRHYSTSSWPFAAPSCRAGARRRRERSEGGSAGCETKFFARCASALPRASSPSPPHPCGGEGRGEEGLPISCQTPLSGSLPAGGERESAPPRGVYRNTYIRSLASILWRSNLSHTRVCLAAFKKVAQRGGRWDDPGWRRHAAPKCFASVMAGLE
jgi:hypothetical protein